MGFSLIPGIRLESVYQITPELLRQRGITLLLLDLDNTLIPYSKSLPSPKLIQWLDTIRRASTDLFIVSNSRRDRPDVFCDAADIPFIKEAGKPSKKAILSAMAQMHRGAGETALVGDQIFTDTLGANRTGIQSILVRPIEMKKPYLAARYALEQPFRALAKEKIK